MRRELGVEVETVEGRYGEFTVLVDGEPVVSAGAMAFLGILPSVRQIRELVERRLRPAGA